MILNLHRKTWKELFIKLRVAFGSLKRDLLKRREISKLENDSLKLKDLFAHKFPSLSANENEEMKCVSCGLCEEICPTRAIQIKGQQESTSRNVYEGPKPKRFLVNLEECIKCNLCHYVCAVDAVELSGEYSGSLVELVVEFSEEKSGSLLELAD